MRENGFESLAVAKSRHFWSRTSAALIAVGLFHVSALADANSASIVKLVAPFSYTGSLDKQASISSDDSDVEKASKALCKRSSICLEFGGTSQGTAFVFLKPNMLLTSLHTFQDYLKAYWKTSSQSAGIPVPLVLYTDNDKAVFGTKAGDTATLVRISDTARQKILGGTLDSDATSDFVLVSLSRSIGNPLPASQQAPASIRTVQIQGFDMGHYFNRYTMNGNIVGRPSGATCNLDQPSLKLIALSDYESSAGSSGAPVFDSSGAVTGIQTGRCVTQNVTIFGYFIPMPWVMQNISSIQ